MVWGGTRKPGKGAEKGGWGGLKWGVESGENRSAGSKKNNHGVRANQAWGVIDRRGSGGEKKTRKGERQRVGLKPIWDS